MIVLNMLLSPNCLQPHGCKGNSAIPRVFLIGNTLGMTKFSTRATPPFEGFSQDGKPFK